MTRFVTPVVAALVACGAVCGQPPAGPGPEHAVLKKLVGTWDAVMAMQGKEYKGVMVYKMDVAGMWLAGAYDGTVEGLPFVGRSFDGYDPAKKKYTGVWVDNMAGSPMVLEGTYDAATQTMTMTTEHPGPDGKRAKWKAVTVTTDPDAIRFGMYIDDAKEPMFTIRYTRRK